MAPRVKIVKKKKNTFNRFESDRHIRLDVYISNIREAGDVLEVSIVVLEESGEVLSECPRLVMDLITILSIYYPTITRSLLYTMLKS
jgi:hypothetical protein